MGIDKFPRIPLRVDKDLRRKPPEKKKIGKLAKGMIFGGALLSSGGAAATYALDHYPYTHEYQATLDTSTALKQLANDKNRLPVEQFTAKRRQLPDKLIMTVALLAHSIQPKYADFESDPALAAADKVSGALVLPLVQRKKVDARYWQALSEELHNPASEDSVRDELIQTADVRLDILKDLSDKYGGVEPIELKESVAYVARNLHLKHEEPTVQNVQAEVRSILERRAALAQENLFDRDVLLVADDEIWSAKDATEDLVGTPRFDADGLQKAIQERMRASGNASATFRHASSLVHDATGYHSTLETISRAKVQALGTISYSTKPLTVYFRGHGGQGYFDMTESSPDRRYDISVKDLADALTDRWNSERSQRSDAWALDVSLIFDDCMMQSFVRSLSETLASRGVPLPRIMVTASEWEQYGFSSFDELGSELAGLLIHNPNLGSVMQHKHDMDDADPSIFTPRNDDPKKLMQVSGIFVPDETGTA